jgi:hypothetical protein
MVSVCPLATIIEYSRSAIMQDIGPRNAAPQKPMGKTLVIAGLSLAAIGALLLLGERLPIKLGRLPGDIRIEGKNGSFYFPVVTCLLLSAIASLVLWLFNRRG